jgi:hypothetical protein
MQRTKSRAWAAAFSLMLVSAILLNTTLSWAASEENLIRLKAGMTKAEVTQIMGKPDSQGERQGEDLCSWFTYKNVGHYKYVNVWFDCQERLVAIDKASK